MSATPPGGAKPIAPIHPDTIAFENKLRGFKFGERISYDELAKLVRKELVKNEAAIKAHIRSAERRLGNSLGMEFGHYHDETTGERGRVRLDDPAIVAKAVHSAGKIGRAAKRIERIASRANHDALTEEQRMQQATVMLAARGAAKFTSDGGRKTIARIVSNSGGRIPELQGIWTALQGG